MHLVQLSTAEIQQLVALSACVGWDYTATEVRTLLASGTVFGLLADGSLVACGAVCLYGDRLASIGMVIVHPDHQGKGLGKRIMQACISTLPVGTRITLVATEEGVPLYERLGFRTVGLLEKLISQRYQPPVGQLKLGGLTVRPLQPSDLPAVIRLDRAATGADRSQFLTVRSDQAMGGLLLCDSRDMPVGFALAVQGPENLVLGPIVAPSPDLALALIDGLVHGHKGPIRLDTPARERSFIVPLIARGFQVVRQPPIMMLNSDQTSYSPDLYAIAAQAFG